MNNPYTKGRCCWRVLVAMCTFYCVSAVSQEQEEHEGIKPYIQELFLAELAFVQEHGELQIGVTGRYWDISDSKLTELSVAIEYGITDQFEVVVGIPYLFIDNPQQDKANGLGDIELGFLYNLTNTNDYVLSAAVETSLTTGDEQKALGESHTQWEPSLLLATQAGLAQLFFSVGGEFSKDESAATWSAAVALPMRGSTAVFELNGTHSDEEDVAYLSVGLVKRLTQNREFQAGITSGLTDDAANWALTLSWNVEF